MGENKDPLEDACSDRKVRTWGSTGLWRLALSLSSPEELDSGVVIVSPRALGFFLGALGGTMNAGVGGAEKA